MRHVTSLRYSMSHCPKGKAPCNWRVTDHHTGRTVEGWLTYDEAEALIADKLLEPADDEPEFMDADDRAASRADHEHQQKMEWAGRAGRLALQDGEGR